MHVCLCSANENCVVLFRPPRATCVKEGAQTPGRMIEATCVDEDLTAAFSTYDRQQLCVFAYLYTRLCVFDIRVYSNTATLLLKSSLYVCYGGRSKNENERETHVPNKCCNAIARV